MSRTGAVERGAIREAPILPTPQARVVAASVRRVTHCVSQGVTPGGFAVGCFRSEWTAYCKQALLFAGAGSKYFTCLLCYLLTIGSE